MNINLTVLLKLPAIGAIAHIHRKYNACFKKERVSHTIKKINTVIFLKIRHTKFHHHNF